LCSKDFLYKQRVWFLKETPSVCPNCATGCSIHIDTNKNIVYRLRPRENQQAQGWFMCDEGRYGFHYVTSAERLKRPFSRASGELLPAHWATILPELRQKFAEAARRQPGGVAAVFSPFLTCEEAYLLASYIKSLSKDATLALGPIPIVGEDETYPKDRRGRPVQPVKFTIRAEKCPNRRGVAAVLQHFGGRVNSFESVVEAAGQGSIAALWVAAGYPRGDGYHVEDAWIDEARATTLRKAGLLVVQDLFTTPLSTIADYVLPSAAWSEKEGTIVNQAGLAQPIARASHAPGESRSEGQVFADLMGRRGLLHAASIRGEVAEKIGALKALAGLPALGTKLELEMA
jgi:NADH-quinone oxidoreductase subunit G